LLSELNCTVGFSSKKLPVKCVYYRPVNGCEVNKKVNKILKKTLIRKLIRNKEVCKNAVAIIIKN